MARNYLFDLHVHSTRSSDSSLPPGVALSRARELGLRGLAFTDHDRVTVLRSPFEDLVVVPGAELSTDRGDLLAIGIQELPRAGSSVPEMIDDIHRQGGVAVIPHVFSRELASICMNDYAFEVLAMIDALEVTSPKPSVDNARARKVAEEAGKARVGGSDAHAAEHLGRGLTTCPEPTLEGLLKAIRGAGTDGLVRKRG